MSDEKVMQIEGVSKSLLKNGIFFCIGWTLFAIGLCTGSVWGYGLFKPPTLMVLLGWGIVGLPKIKAALKGGFAAAFAPYSDYEVVKKDQYGNVVSKDGGMESAQMNGIFNLLVAGVVFAIGGVVAIIHLLILMVKYLSLKYTDKVDDVTKPKGLTVIITCVAVFFGAFIVGGTIQNIDTAIYNSNVKQVLKVKEGVTLVVTGNMNGVIGSTPGGTTGPTKVISVGTILKTTGSAVEAPNGSPYIPVEYDGFSGFINASRVKVKK